MKNVIKSLLHRIGYDIIRYDQYSDFPKDFKKEEVDLIKFVRPFTMTSNERIHSFIHSVNYIVGNKVPGAIVECGVWRGGSMMAALKTLISLEDTSREVYLYDTYEGMVEPTKQDTKINGTIAAEAFKQFKRVGIGSEWCLASLDDVKQAVYRIGYPEEKIHFVKGKVEETLPGTIPENVAILRLDTDWYESTKHELIHLFPRLTNGGVLLLDDYGSWQGAQKAVDEYITEHKVQILLNRLDNSGRVAIKIT